MKVTLDQIVHLTFQVVIFWMSQVFGIVVIILNTGLVGSKKQMTEYKQSLDVKVYRGCLLVAAFLTLIQIVHFLCVNLKLRIYVREWCYAQYDMADLDASRLVDQSQSRAGLNESKSDTITKKIKVRYPLFLTKQNGNMFRRAQREDVKSQSSARNASNNQNQISSSEKTKSAVFAQKTPKQSQRGSKMDPFQSPSAIVITEGNKEEITEQFVAKALDDEPMSTARYKYTITQGDKDDDPQKEPNVPQLPDDALDDDSLCTICYSQKSNTVLLDCGHGGICIDCATDTMKKNNHCLFCRARVVQIIEIDTDEIKRGLYKVVNSFYVSDGTYP